MSQVSLVAAYLAFLSFLGLGRASAFSNSCRSLSRNLSNKGIPSVPNRHGPMSSFSSPLLKPAFRGGGLPDLNAKSGEAESKCPVMKTTRFVSSLWGAGGVIYILYKAVNRVLPIALEPFSGGGAARLSPFQITAYIGTCLFFAYAEGYKGFQKKFSPLVAGRAFTIKPRWNHVHHLLLAPLYSMGLFHATRKRMIVSWSLTSGIAVVVAMVKKLPYPWRNIVDAGVVVGLSWGCVCIAFEYFRALFTAKLPNVDLALP